MGAFDGWALALQYVMPSVVALLAALGATWIAHLATEAASDAGIANAGSAMLVRRRSGLFKTFKIPTGPERLGWRGTAHSSR